MDHPVSMMGSKPMEAVEPTLLGIKKFVSSTSLYITFLSGVLDLRVPQPTDLTRIDQEHNNTSTD